MNEQEMRGKVIKGLECCAIDGGCGACPYDSFKDCPGSHPTPETLMKDALALLKAQEPVKPVMDIDTWKCWNCGHTLEYQELLGDNVLFYEQYNYCPECGRAVKWE